MATPYLCVFFLFLQTNVLCLEDQERIFTSHRRSSSQLAGSMYEEVPSRSAVEAMVFCSSDEKCASFDFDRSTNTSKLHYTKSNGGRYQVKNRECPKIEGFHFAENLNLCFWKTTEACLWEECRKECQKKGGDLISLDTDEKFMYMKETIGNELRSYWLGAYRLGSEWAWLSGVPIPLSSKFWHGGQPDRVRGSEKNLISGGHYFGQFGLDDGYVDSKYRGLCEITMT